MTPVRGTARNAGMVKSSLTQKTYHPQASSARHEPETQFSPLPQTWPQAPQLTRSVCKS
jgi:hypothetical protein